MAGDEEAPLVPADEKPRGDEAPPPPTDSERPTSAGIETDAAAAAAKESSSGAAPAVESDGRSFSQLLAGAMTSPVANPRAPPILTVPVVAVPCLLAPASMIESPGFPGQFAMTHQAVLAAVTAQAQMQIQAAYPPSETVTNSFPHPVIPTVSPVPLHQVSPAPETYPDDVYHWRKYGQKQVKNTENSRSYYRCAVSDCLAKKKVECSPDGKIREVIYRSRHIHDPPQKHRHSREKESQAVGPSGENEIIEHPGVEPKESDPGKTNNLSGKELPVQQLYNSSECKEDAGIATKNNLAKEPYPKRRQVIRTCEPYPKRRQVIRTCEPYPKRRLGEISKIPSTPTAKAVREYIVQTEIDARHLSDGYRWRKYGQKMVKGNPNPRSYYRCTHDGCPVRKHVERASHDAKALVITYEGEHNHDQPMPKYVGEQPASDGPASSTDKELNTSTSLSDKNPAQELNLIDVTKELSTDKTSEFGGEKAMKSVHSTTSIEVNERTNTEGVITTLLDKNPSPVSVKNA